MEKVLKIAGNQIDLKHVAISANKIHVHIGGVDNEFSYSYLDGGRLLLTNGIHNLICSAEFLKNNKEARVRIGNSQYDVYEEIAGGGATHTEKDGYFSPMTATVKQVMIKSGDAVTAGTPMIVIEAMKLQISIESKEAGIVEEVFCKVGDLISEGKELVKVKAQ